MATETTRFILYCKRHLNVSRHVVNGYPTLEAAVAASIAEKSSHFKAAGWEVEKVVTVREVVASNPQS